MTSGKSLSLCLAALSTVKGQPNDGLLDMIEKRVKVIPTLSLTEQDYALLLNAMAKLNRDSDIIFSAVFDALSSGHVYFTPKGLSAILNATAKLQREVPGSAVPELLSQIKRRTQELSGWQFSCVVHGLGRSVPNANKDGQLISVLSDKCDELINDNDVTHQGFVMLLDGFSKLEYLQISVVSMFCKKAPDWGLSEQAIVMGISSMAKLNYYNKEYLQWSHNRLSNINKVPPIGLVTALVGYAKLEYHTGVEYIYNRIINEGVINNTNISQLCIIAYALLLDNSILLLPTVLRNILTPLAVDKVSLSNASKLQLIAVMQSLINNKAILNHASSFTVHDLSVILKEIDLVNSAVKLSTNEVDDANSSSFQEDIEHTLKKIGQHRWSSECEVTPYIVDIIEVKQLSRHRHRRNCS
ncbi:hypothetical protein FOL47_007531 [Perkinsus chesapeaki]|uniref:Uncharacterized protein n=1 Tax=Perkinsus chesapeaki TaxID=330153 RepID=A0A7J6LK28_PERCH|nr:hypothetical protein FOL47_007531 [Perkinsus chesapeaki]